MSSCAALTLDSVLAFGKHQGKTVAFVSETDPMYLEWCLNNIDGFELDEEADQRLDLDLDWWLEEHARYGV